MGLSAAELAELASALALGGIDLIKDDHGLADQPFCRFEERVARCAEAVARANAQTGEPCLYAPNVTAPADSIARPRPAGQARRRRRAAGRAGSHRLRRHAALAADDAIDLPILCHPALHRQLR